jgi:myo-inositol-1(or 4)-monophosphatase
VAARPPAARVGEARLGDALIATGIPWKGHGDLARYGKILDAISPEVAGIRRFGSAALDLAWVAAGRFDGYFEEDVNLYDAAAGLLLVREAGGLCQRLSRRRADVRARRVSGGRGRAAFQAAEAGGRRVAGVIVIPA